jgi:ABC-type uncharacterized transport system permease subunit
MAARSSTFGIRRLFRSRAFIASGVVTAIGGAIYYADITNEDRFKNGMVCKFQFKIL